MAGQPARLTDKQRETIKTAVVKKLQQKQIEERAAKAKQNQDDGDKFLADNGKKPGVKTTDDGLQYEVVTEGKGDHPTKDDKVTVNYKGSLIDGTVFDSSYERNQPVTFPLGNVIPGWTEGVQLMTPGAKYKFYIPSNGLPGCERRRGPEDRPELHPDLRGGAYQRRQGRRQAGRRAGPGAEAGSGPGQEVSGSRSAAPTARLMPGRFLRELWFRRGLEGYWQYFCAASLASLTAASNSSSVMREGWPSAPVVYRRWAVLSLRNETRSRALAQRSSLSAWAWVA